jgi:RsiW-degrading membrane proteinase PrsW (M82 family)
VGVAVILALLFSLLVALFWLARFRRMDKFEKEPERLVYLAFFAGILSTVPSVILEFPLQTSRFNSSPSLFHLLFLFLWVGMVEETFKFLAVRLTVYNSDQFNEVMDGMIYMVSAAMGFAAAENVGYMLGFGFSVGLFRAILSYLAHLSFSAILGYYLAKAKIEKNGNWLWPGFSLAVLLHWFYNFFIAVGTVRTSLEFFLFGVLVWVSGLILTFILAKKAQAVSPFRTTHLLPRRMTRPCQACGKSVSVKAWICHHCGEPLSLEEDELTLRV